MSLATLGIPVVVGIPTADSITVQFDAGVLADNVFNQFYVRYGPGVRAAPPAPPGTVVQTKLLNPLDFSWYPATLYSGTQFRATVPYLSPDTTYYFDSVVRYSRVTVTSLLSDPITTASLGPVGPSAPSAPPSVPEIIAPASQTAATLYFTSAGVTGTPEPEYKLQYSIAPGGPFEDVEAAAPIPELSLYVAALTGLTASTTYYARSVAFNTQGTKTSANMTFTTAGGGGVAPSGPPTVPTLVSATARSIVVQFDTAGITGTPTPSFSVRYDTNASGGFVSAVAASLVSGTIYSATVTGLAPSTIYFFKSLAANGTPPAQISAVSTGFSTSSPAPPAGPLKTNLVTPFLLQGPRFGSTAPWVAVDYRIDPGAVGATRAPGSTSISGQQVFATMYAGTQGTPGALNGDPANPVPYAGACGADQVFAILQPGSYSDVYLNTNKTAVAATGGRILASWGGFYADIRGLFGPYNPNVTGFTWTNYTGAQVMQSFLNVYCGVSSAPNPLGWRRSNTNSTSGWNFVYDGIVLDFENVGNGNPLNSWPYAPPGSPPAFPALATDPAYAPYIAQLGAIPAAYYAAAPTKFLGNAPVSLSIVADQGTTNICAANTALNTWYPFASATVPPAASGYNPGTGDQTLALNHPNQLSYMDDIFVQFYNEGADYYLGGQYFANLLACWGFVALRAQTLGRKKTTINIGLATGQNIPGGPNGTPNVQGPTPNLGSPPNAPGNPPPNGYTYWYPTYAANSDSPTTGNRGPNYSTGWPDIGPTKDPLALAAAITAATTILKSATNNPSLVPSDWCSGCGFWAANGATTMAKDVYTNGNPFSPGSVLPSSEVYCWSDAYYPALDPQWTGNVPITSTLT